MKHVAVESTSSNFFEDFLSTARNRVACLTTTTLLPRPRDARLGADGQLSPMYYGEDHRPPVIERFPADLCFRFARLAESSDEQIRRFMAQWGLLRSESPSEPAQCWRSNAKLARAILRFTAELYGTGSGCNEDWELLCNYVTGCSLGKRLGLPVNFQLQIVAAALNKWYGSARGNCIVVCRDERLAFLNEASNLLGVLILQIAHAITRTHQRIPCDGCGRWFRPDQPQSRGSRRYCKKCQEAKVSRRHAVRDCRARKKLRDQQSKAADSDTQAVCADTAHQSPTRLRPSAQNRCTGAHRTDRDSA